MEILLRKYLGAIDLVVIAVCSLSIAHATATLIESNLTRLAPSTQGIRPTPVAPPQRSFPKSQTAILTRNIFCSNCPPFLEERIDSTPPRRPTPQATALPLRLLAVMFAPPPNDPRWSVAIIRHDDDKTAGPYTLGARIRAATISHIGETRVYLDVSGRQEYLDLATPARLAAQRPSAELDMGIKKITELKYEIQRQTLDSLLGNISALSQVVRIVPEIKNGKAIGFRLFNVRPDGLFAKIGLRDGDVISAINGLEVTSPDNALTAYTKLRSAGHLSVGLERNGQKQTLEYAIR